MSYEFLHVHRRKEEAKVNEVTTSPLIRALDKIAYLVAILVPLSSLDQVIRIWEDKSAVGVSPLLWIVLFTTSIFWIVYASVHKVRVVLVGHIVWLILTAAVLIEIFIFS